MENNLISVIVPVYKVEQYLKRCVDSIINQTYKNLEIILVDDGSPDGCPKICDEYAELDSRVKVIHKKNGGVSSARNEGLKQSNGTFVAFVDSDDWLDETMYEKLIEKQEETDADLVWCRYSYVQEKTNLISQVNEIALGDFCKSCNLQYFYNHTSNNKMIDGNVVISNNVQCNIWRVLFKKTAIGNIKFTVDVKFMEDVIFLTEILKNNDKKCDFIDEYLHFYLIRQGSAVRSRSQSIVENSKNYLDRMSLILKNTEYEKYLPALEYFCYSECVLAKVVSNADIDLKEVKRWGSKENYKVNKTITIGTKQKIKYFLIRHNIFWLLKLLYKIK